jgi:YetF N-terminal transmembrane domain
MITAVPVLALFNLFGQMPSDAIANSPTATLIVSSPNQVRGGLLYQARFAIVAHQEIKNATLNLGRGWVIRAIVLYVFVVFVMRIVGRRELGTLTPFDLVLPIVLGDAIQQGLTQDDYSVTGAIVAVSTLAVSDPGCQ